MHRYTFYIYMDFSPVWGKQTARGHTMLAANDLDSRTTVLPKTITHDIIILVCLKQYPYKGKSLIKGNPLQREIPYTGKSLVKGDPL